jgi:hypothetical protein
VTGEIKQNGEFYVPQFRLFFIERFEGVREQKKKSWNMRTNQGSQQYNCMIVFTSASFSRFSVRVRRPSVQFAIWIYNRTDGSFYDLVLLNSTRPSLNPRPLLEGFSRIVFSPTPGRPRTHDPLRRTEQKRNVRMHARSRSRSGSANEIVVPMMD